MKQYYDDCLSALIKINNYYNLIDKIKNKPGFILLNLKNDPKKLNEVKCKKNDFVFIKKKYYDEPLRYDKFLIASAYKNNKLIYKEEYAFYVHYYMYLNESKNYYYFLENSDNTANTKNGFTGYELKITKINKKSPNLNNFYVIPQQILKELNEQS